MTISPTQTQILSNLSGSSSTYESDQAQKEEDIGRDTFLKMLVAQLQNQDPLNPMDGTDFSAQLAQFSQLEQLMAINESMQDLTKAFESNAEGDVVSLIGREVSGKVDSMDVEDGIVSGGYYNLEESGDVMVTITDSSGRQVRTLIKGQQGAGVGNIGWDGYDNNGNQVPDGTYTYSIMANSGYGFEEVSNIVSGRVDAVVYENGKPYLVVQDQYVDPDSLIGVANLPDSATGSGSTENTAVNYLGKTITSDIPLILVENQEIYGNNNLSFEIAQADNVTVTVYDDQNSPVRTIQVPQEETTKGINTVNWDGTDDSGQRVADGLYSYRVNAESTSAATPIKEEVSGIKYMYEKQYLVLKETGRLVALFAVNGVT